MGRVFGGGRGEGTTFYRRIILIHKVTLDKLDGKAALAHAAAADHHELVFPQELSTGAHTPSS